jgi:hypothetical protein
VSANSPPPKQAMDGAPLAHTVELHHRPVATMRMMQLSELRPLVAEGRFRRPLSFPLQTMPIPPRIRS